MSRPLPLCREGNENSVCGMFTSPRKRFTELEIWPIELESNWKVRIAGTPLPAAGSDMRFSSGVLQANNGERRSGGGDNHQVAGGVVVVLSVSTRVAYVGIATLDRHRIIATTRLTEGTCFQF